jgi:hypothetical protein
MDGVCSLDPIRAASSLKMKFFEFSLNFRESPCGRFLANFWQNRRESQRYPQITRGRTEYEDPCERRASITPSPRHSPASVGRVGVPGDIGLMIAM